MNRKISVIGLGYVGLPLAVEFGKVQPTVGFDISEEYVEYDAQSDAGRVELAFSAWRRKKDSKMGQVIPGNARRFRFLIDLKKVDERWRIHRVTRQPNK